MTISNAYPNILQNGATADATQVMADFYQIQNDVNANAANAGANTNITSLTGLTTPLAAIYGGTGVSNYVAGSVLAAATASTITGVAPGAAGTVMVSNGAGTPPSFQTAAFTITGEIKMWSTNTPPTGYLECNGAAVSRTTYATLFAVIGTTYGAGDGSTTFNLPDTRGYFIRGWDHGAGVDTGRAFGSTQADAFKAHNHTANVSDPTHFHGIPTFAGNTAGGSNANAFSASTGGTTAAASTGIGVSITNTGGTETRPLNLALMFIIKT